MTALFSKLVDMSVSAGFVVLAVVLLRLLLRKSPKSLRCCLWALVAVRLLCPVSFESALSVIPPAEPISRETAVSPDPAPEERAEATVQDTQVTAAVPIRRTEAQLEAAEPEPNVDWLTAGSWVWLVGMVLMLLYAALSYLRLWRRVRVSIDLGNGVYLCDYIGTPFILGLVRPKIYLPSDMDPADAPHVLVHEKAHIKRRDHWWKPLGFALLSVYWFHPLLWLAYCLLCRDIELACDERVIRDMDVPQKKAYSEALLRCSVPRSLISACPLAFGEVGVKQRVKSVLSYKKPGLWVVLAAALAAVIAAVCLLTDPETDTLSDFLEYKKSDIVSVEIQTNSGGVSLSSESALEATLDLLKAVRYDPTPHSGATSADPYPTDEYGWLYPSIRLETETGETAFFFTYDCTQFWVRTEDGDTAFYDTANPPAVQEFLNKYVSPAARDTVTAEAFAAGDQPWQWLQGVSLEAVDAVWARWKKEERYYQGCRMPEFRFEELLEILHAVPRSAVTEGGVYGDFDELSLYCDALAPEGEVPEVSLVIGDGANGLTAVLRCCSDHVELLLLDRTLADINSHFTYTGSTQVWHIENRRLVQALLDLREHPDYYRLPGLGGGEGWVRELPAEVTWGEAAIRLPRRENLEYEIQEYTEQTGSMGIRCRPNGESGWLYFSFWPGGYHPAEENHYYTSRAGWTTGYNDTLASYPSPESEIWSYIRYSRDIGDFAIVNEGADRWMPEYEDEISVLELLATFDGGQPVSVHLPDGDYTQSDDPLLGPWTYGFRSGAGYSGSFRISEGWLWDASQEGLLSFWPREILRGKITLSWQETPFAPEEGLTVEPISLSSGTYTAWTAKKEGAKFWTCLWIDMGSGSILFRSYATDTWTDGQLQEAMDMIESITLHSERLHTQDTWIEQRLLSVMDLLNTTALHEERDQAPNAWTEQRLRNTMDRT